MWLSSRPRRISKSRPLTNAAHKAAAGTQPNLAASMSMRE